MSGYQERIKKAYEYLTWSLERYNEEISKLEECWSKLSDEEISWLLYLKLTRSKKYDNNSNTSAPKKREGIFLRPPGE